MKLMGDIKVVFFDLDNTLWDFEKNSKLTLNELYEEKIKIFDKDRVGCCNFIEVFEKINEGLWEDYRCKRVSKEQLRLLRFYKSLKEIGIDDKSFAEAVEKEYVSRTALQPFLIDNAVDVLNYLHGKYSLGLITNGFAEAQEVKLKNSGIGKYFDYVCVSEIAGFNKPDRGIFDYALKNAGINPAQALFIGDEYDVDMLGAQNAGIKGIWFNKKHTGNTKKYNCIEIFSLSELLNIL